jgi:hypothetical protein
MFITEAGLSIWELQRWWPQNHWLASTQVGWFMRCIIACHLVMWTCLYPHGTSVWEQCLPGKIFHVTWLILPYLEHHACFHKIVYSYWANRWWNRWDTTDSVVESILGNSLYIIALTVSAHLKS